MAQTVHQRLIRPNDFTVSQLTQFHALVRAGGQVQSDGLLDRIMRAAWVGFVSEGQTLFATAALKRPQASYTARIFESAGLAPNYSALELGWFYTVPRMRGQGFAGELAQRLCSQEATASLFAVTNSEVIASARILRACGFAPAGTRFPGRGMPAHDLTLWLRQPQEVN